MIFQNSIIREFRQFHGRTKKPVIWKIWRDDNKILTEWGQLNGEMTNTVQSFETLNKGKKNEKSPEIVAQEYMDRNILLRLRKGFKEVNTETGEIINNPSCKETVIYNDSIDFNKLPQNLRFYKPQNILSKYLEKLIKDKKAWFIRKRNGNMFIVCVNEDGFPLLYSSTTTVNPKSENFTWLDRFPHFQKSLIGKLPPNTILLTEMVSDEKYDDLDYMGSLLRSLTDKAINLQEENHYPWLVVWDIAFYEGKQLLGVETIQNRLNLAKKTTKNLEYITTPEIFKTGSKFDGTSKTAIEIAKRRDYEGFVVVDPESNYNNNGISFDGKPSRPKTCAKLKPKYEADFILKWDPDNGVGTYGKGRKSRGVGAFFAYLINGNNEEQFISKVGGGLTDLDVVKYAKPGIVFVGQIEFTAVTKDKSLQFPEFVRERKNKKTSECTIDQLPN